MVSKNNRIKKMEEAAERRPHFGIRKLTIGAASVLLGTTLFLSNGANEAHAETADNGKDGNDVAQASNKQATIEKPKQVVVEVQNDDQTDLSKAQTSQEQENKENKKTDAIKDDASANDQATTKKDDNVVADKSVANRNIKTHNLKSQDSTDENKDDKSAKSVKATDKNVKTENRAKSVGNKTEEKANATSQVEVKADASNPSLNSAITNNNAKAENNQDKDDAKQAELNVNKGLNNEVGTTELDLGHNVLLNNAKAIKNAINSGDEKVDTRKTNRLFNQALFALPRENSDAVTKNSKAITDWNGLQSAVNSGAATINVKGGLSLGTLRIDHDVVIDGGKSGATLNFGTNVFELADNVNLTLANVTINSENAGGAIVSDNDNNVITFKNVTNNKNSLFNGKGQVHIQGKVTTNVNDNSQVGDEALQGFADAKNTGAGTNLYGTNSSTTVQRANSAIINNVNKRKVPNIYASNLYIDDNAILNVNRTATGDGIVLRDGARTEGNTGNITSTVANRGKLTVGNNAVLNINLKDSQMSGEQLKATERIGIDNLNAGVRVNTSGSFLTGKNAIVNIKSGHGRAIAFSENNVNTDPKVWGNYVYRGQEGGGDGGYTVSAKGSTKFTDFIQDNPGIKNEFKLGNGTKMNVMGREAFMLGNNSVFDSGENSNVLVHNYGHGNGLDMGSIGTVNPKDNAGQLRVGVGSTVQFFSDGKDTNAGQANFGMNNYISMGGGGKINVLKDATLRVILTNRGMSTYNDDININSRDPRLSPGVYVGNNAILDVQSDAKQGNAELIAIPLSASKDINFILDNVKYVNLQKTVKTSATTLLPASPDLNKAAAHAHIPNSKPGYGNLIIMNTGRDGKGHLKAFGNLAAFKWNNENLNSNGLDFDPNQSVSANYSRFENSANQTWSNMYGFDMPYSMFSTVRNSGEVWVDPNGSTAGTNVNSNNGAAFADFVKGFSPYMSQRLVVIGHSIQPVFNQRTVHYVVQDVDDNGNPIETDPTQMREIANPFVQAAEGNNAQSQLLYKDNATDQLIRIERNSDGTPKFDSEGNVIPVRDSNGNYESDGNSVNKWNSKDNSIESSNGNTYFKSYEGPQTITGKDGNGNTIESLDNGLYALATDAQLATITSNRNQVVYGGRVANSKNFANTTDDFKNGNFYNTYKDGNLYIVYRAVQEKANLNIVDDTEDKTLDSTSVTGKDNTAINFGSSTADSIKGYLDKGYKIVNITDDTNKVKKLDEKGQPVVDKDGKPVMVPAVIVDENGKPVTDYDTAAKQFGNFDENPEVDQDFTVHLVHEVVPVDPKTPPTDIPKNPDGKPAVDPSTLTKDVTLEVTYKNSDGTAFTGKSPKNAKQTVTFTGTTYVDKVTGQVVNAKQDGNDWIVDKDNTATPETKWTPETDSFTKVVSPSETGYHVSNVSAHADGNDVAAISGITKDSENITVTVTYDKDKAKQGQINVKFHDTTDNVDIPGYGKNSGNQDEGTSFTYNPSDDIKTLEGKGYVLDGKVPTIPTSITEGTQDFVINMKHGVKPVNPDNPGDKYKKDDLQKTITRNIKYVDQKGNTVAQDHNDTFTFTAQGNEDEVTHNLVNLNPDGSIKDQKGQLTWNAADHNFDKVVSPSIDKMHVVSVTPSDQAEGNDVKQVTVKHDSDNINVVVTYAPNGQEVKDQKDVPASQTTKFVDENGKELAKSVVQNSNFQFSGNTYDKETGKKISDGSWNEESHKFNTVNAPVIPGYVAEAKTADGLTATIAKPDVENQIVYHKIGKIIPVDKITNEPIPGADQPQYKNDSTDPTKVISNEPIPKVDNYTPVDPSPITPEDPTKDTKVPYQRAVEGSVKYIDDNTNKTLTTDSLKGFAGDKIDYTTADKIADYEKQGYELVSNNFKDGNETYAEKGNNFEVHLKHGLTPVTPEDPKGVDPKELTKPVKETVHYEGAGDKTPKDVVQDATWTRNLTQDKVTGKLVPNGEYDTEWTPSKENYDEVKSPVIEGFHPDKETVPVTKVTQDNIDVTVKYSPNGTEVKDQKDLPASQTTKFVDENGKELAKSVVQNSNFHFSGNTYDKVTGEKTKDGSWNEESHKFNSVDAPVIQGYVAEAKTADGLTATVDNPDVHNEIVYHKIGKIVPVDNITKKPIPGAEQPQYKNDQNDPTKVVPNEPIPEVTDYLPVNPGQQVTPENPTKDTEVPYKQIVRGTVKYIDDTTKGTLKTDKIQGFIGDKVDYATAGIIKGYEDSGYKLVSNNFKDGNETYARTGNNFEVHLVHTYSPVTPDNPHGVDPKELTKDVKETVHYTGAGDKTPKDNVQTSQWTRQFTWDNVDKKIVPNGELDKDWSITPGQKTDYDEVKSPEIEGYHPDKETVPTTKVTQDNIEVTVTYAPNGQDIRDTKDVPATQTTKFVDENGKELAQSVVQNSNFHYSGDTYDKFNNQKIKDGSWNEESHKFNSVDAPVINGYVAEAKTADGLTATVDKPNVENQIVYHKIGKIIPVDPNHNPIPDAPTPEYKNDPKDPTKVVPNEPTPKVPGWTTNTPDVTPNDPTKDTQVVYNQATNGTVKYIDDTAKTTLDTDNLPNGYVGDKINYTTAGKIADYEKQGFKLVSNSFKDGNETYAKSGNNFEVHFVHNLVPVTPENPHGVDPSLVQKDVKETVKYVGAGDKTPKDNVQTSKWTRTLTMDQVTGNLVPNGELDTDWAISSGEKTDYDEVKTPEIEGYHADKTTIPATKVTQQDITEIVTYTPNDQEVRDIKDVPASQTTKFIDDNGNQLADPVIQHSNFHYSGNTYDKQTGKEITKGSWDAENHKFNSVNAPVIEGYVAEAKTAEGLTATIDNPDVTNQIVYHKIGKIIPVDPNHDPIPDAPTPEYKNDPKDPTKVVPNEPVPEVPNYTPVDPTPITPQDPTKNTQVVYNQIVEGTVTYFDDTTGQTLGNVDSLKGYVGDKIDYSTEGRIDNYTSKGYKLVSDGFTTSDQIFKKAHNNFEVHFVHSYSPVNPENPNPKVNKDEYTKEYTSTVHYTGAGSQTPKDNVQTSTWTRTLTIDNVTGNIIPGGQYDTDWAPDKKSYEAVPTPNVPDFTPDMTEVPAKTTEQKDLYTTVNYSPVAKDQKAKVQYIDQDNNNKVIEESKELTGKAGDKIDYSTANTIAKLENKGYELVNDGFPAGAAFDNDEKTDQIFKVVLKHGHQPVNPGNPGKPGEPINPNDPEGPIYPTDSDKVTKDVTRTIHYVDANGQQVSAPVGQSAHFTAEGVLDKVTGQWSTPLTWSKDQNFDAVKAPEISGSHVDNVTVDEGKADYITNDGNVASTTVNHDSEDVVITVHYAKNGTEIQNKQNIPSTQTVKFVDENGKEIQTANVKNSEFNYSGDTVDTTTGKTISTGSWNEANHQYETVDVPVIDGYVAVNGYTKNSDGKIVAGGLTATHDNPNVTATVVYHKIGKIVPETPDHTPIPDAPTPDYKNDPKDPTKVVPNEPVPEIPGYTPNVPTVTPEDPTKDTHVVYTKNPEIKDQNAVVNYIDSDNNNSVITTSGNLSGKANTAINYSTAKTLEELVNKGYELVINGFDPDGKAPNFDNDDNTTQTYQVVLKHQTVPVNPDKPGKPGEPINPNDPEGPKWPENTGKEGLSKSITRTIHYDGAGNNTPQDVKQTVNFTASGVLDKVTGKWTTPLTWNAESQTVAGEKSPVVKGYYVTGVDKDSQDKVNVDSVNLTRDGSDYTVTVHYAPVGNIVPVDPNGNPIPNVPEVPYTNDPSDPSKVTPNEPVPSIPGYTPNIPTVTPQDPGKDTPVIYTPNAVEATGKVVYVDDTAKTDLRTDDLKGNVGEKIDYSTADKISDFEKKGYKLVSNSFKDGNETFAKDGNVFEVHFEHDIQPVNPQNPGKPGEPINPDDPEGPKFPEGSDQVTKDVTRTIHYEGAGNGTPQDIKQTSHFTGSGVLDKVTGQWITPITWTGNGDLEGAKTPVVDGYHVTRVSRDSNDNINVDSTTVNHESSDYTVTVSYAKNGKIIPVDPNGNPIPNVPTPTYPTDPKDPSKVTPNEPVPSIPGYTPNVPTVTPQDPGKDTTVVYVQEASGKVAYIDDTTGKTMKTDNLNGHVGDKITYTTAGEIAQYENQGYELVSNNFKDGNESFTAEGNNFEVHFKHATQPVNPSNPGKPGEPINPNDPEGPKWPNGTDANSLKKTGTQTIHYVGAGENTPKDSVTNAEFDHEVVIDKVTGEIIKDNGWTPSSHTFDTVNTPVIPGYHADKTVAGGKTVTPDNPTATDTVTYVKNGQELKNKKNIPASQTIKFVDENGNELKPENKQTSEFNYTGDTYDQVTGDLISKGEWDATNHKFTTVAVPVIDGYVAVTGYTKNADGKIVVGGLTATTDDPNVTATIVYKKIGNIIPVDNNGNKIPDPQNPGKTVPEKPFVNDPNDPTKVVPNEQVPSIPGYTPSTPTVTPTDPTTDIPVVYNKDQQPTQPTTPQTPEVPVAPTAPEEPTTPAPTVPAPKPEETPTAPAPTTPEEPAPKPHATKTPEKPVAKKEATPAPKPQVVKSVKPAVKATKTVAPKAAKAEAQTLPQTGEENNDAAIALGAAASMLSLIGLAGVKRRKRD